MSGMLGKPYQFDRVNCSFYSICRLLYVNKELIIILYVNKELIIILYVNKELIIILYVNKKLITGKKFSSTSAPI